MTTKKFDFSRRNFLKGAATLAAGRAILPWGLNFVAIGKAAAAVATDYKALVCVFLYGGNDHTNTLVPYDDTSYLTYLNLRSNLAYPRSSLATTVLNPSRPPVDSQGVIRQFALAPELAPLLPVFDSGRMAILLNIGTLIQPTTKTQYLAKSVPLPSRLFSHIDQRSEWQSSHPDGATVGWGGQIEDVLDPGGPIFSAINIYNNTVFLSGRSTVQYQVTSDGPVPLHAQKRVFGSVEAAAALTKIMTATYGHPFESDYAKVTADALVANRMLTTALASAPAISTEFPSDNSLADQLKMAAQVASVAKKLGVRRQVFFVGLGGFDNHDNAATAHPPLLTKVGSALSAFYSATVELGLSPNITTFTASEFGRTLTVNTHGTDHGWGSMHFVLGGAVNGRRYYGVPPVVANNGPDDVGQGRLLPTTSVDQYAATLGSWFGTSDSELLTILPNLANYDPGMRNLHFV